MSSLNGSWIEIFRAGDYGSRGRWTAEDLDRLAAAYDTRLQPAPVVVGHPGNDAPAYGWIARLRRAGQSLWAQLEKVDAGFERLLRDGRFRQRSVALYRNFAPAGGPYLRHVGFLGAQPPAVKGLAPVRFFAAATGPEILYFSESIRAEQENNSVGQTASPAEGGGLSAQADQHSFLEVPMPESKLENFFDYLRGFFTEPAPQSLGSAASSGGNDSSSPGDVGRGLLALSEAEGNPAEKDAPTAATSAAATSAAASAPSAVAEDSQCAGSPDSQAFAGRLAELEQRIEALTPATPSKSQPEAQAEIAVFVESLRAAGKFPPAFDRLGVTEFLRLLAAQPATVISCSGEEAQSVCHSDPYGEESYPSGKSSMDPSGPGEQTLLAWFQEFLTRLPQVIDFGELTASAAGAEPAAPVIRFTAPRRGVEVDPESVELAERAETLAASEDITYGQALTRLRRESKMQSTSA